jgi:hypothetical protein
MNHHLTATLLAAITVAALIPLPVSSAGRAEIPNPDFTKGEPIPATATHDWNLGATGARGWMFSDQLGTTEARQIRVTAIAAGSPADGILQAGDVILGVGGKPFSHDPRVEFGKALTHAESEAGGGKLALTRWRDGTSGEVVVNLPVLGSYSPTAPYECPKSRRILELGCEALAKRMADPSYAKSKGINAITRPLNALALLASGNPKYLPLLRGEARWAAGFSAGDRQPWWYGYTIMFLSEYVLATGDRSVLPGLERLALETANGQSMVGSWGHGFAEPDGRVGGYGMMNSPGVPLTISLVMARAAGVSDPKVAAAIERSAKLLRFYAGKGSVPYGDHAPWIQTHGDNGKNEMAAVLFNLLDESDKSEYFARMSVASHGPERDCGHTGNFFNMTWAMPAVALSGPQASGAWMHEFGTWYYDLARAWDGSFPHQGPPETRPDKYGGWDSTGAYLLAYAMPLKKTLLTGKHPGKVPQLGAAAAHQLILDGRGWSTKTRHSVYADVPVDELLQRLGSWSPIVRERAAMALARRKEVPVDVLVKMLGEPDLYTRLGACQTLAQLKDRAAPAVPALRETLDAEDLWLRVKAADALAAIGQAAMPALPRMLEMLAAGPNPGDPRGMEQRFLSFAVFDTMLKNSLDGVDRDALSKAVVAGLRNDDGRARSSVSRVYSRLTYEELKPLLPAIHQAVVDRSPSGIMFSDGVRLNGLKLMAKHHIREGLPLCISILDLQRWGKKARIQGCVEAISIYGAAAKPLLPQMRQLEKDLLAHRESKGFQPEIEKLRKLIRDIDASTEVPELRGLK